MERRPNTDDLVVSTDPVSVVDETIKGRGSPPFEGENVISYRTSSNDTRCNPRPKSHSSTFSNTSMTVQTHKQQKKVSATEGGLTCQKQWDDGKPVTTGHITCPIVTDTGPVIPLVTECLEWTEEEVDLSISPPSSVHAEREAATGSITSGSLSQTPHYTSSYRISRDTGGKNRLDIKTPSHSGEALEDYIESTYFLPNTYGNKAATSNVAGIAIGDRGGEGGSFKTLKKIASKQQPQHRHVPRFGMLSKAPLFPSLPLETVTRSAPMRTSCGQVSYNNSPASGTTTSYKLADIALVFGSAISDDSSTIGAPLCLNCRNYGEDPKSLGHREADCPYESRCYTCLQTGHAARQCTSNPVPGSPLYLHDDQCDHCGERGHRSNYCKAEGGRLSSYAGAEYIPDSSFPNPLIINSQCTIGVAEEGALASARQTIYTIIGKAIFNSGCEVNNVSLMLSMRDVELFYIALPFVRDTMNIPIDADRKELQNAMEILRTSVTGCLALSQDTLSTKQQNGPLSARAMNSRTVPPCSATGETGNSVGNSLYEMRLANLNLPVFFQGDIHSFKRRTQITNNVKSLVTEVRNVATCDNNNNKNVSITPLIKDNPHEITQYHAVLPTQEINRRKDLRREKQRLSLEKEIIRVQQAQKRGLWITSMRHVESSVIHTKRCSVGDNQFGSMGATREMMKAFEEGNEELGHQHFEKDQRGLRSRTSSRGSQKRTIINKSCTSDIGNGSNGHIRGVTPGPFNHSSHDGISTEGTTDDVGHRQCSSVFTAHIPPNIDNIISIDKKNNGGSATASLLYSHLCTQRGHVKDNLTKDILCEWGQMRPAKAHNSDACMTGEGDIDIKYPNYCDVNSSDILQGQHGITYKGNKQHCAISSIVPRKEKYADNKSRRSNIRSRSRTISIPVSNLFASTVALCEYHLTDATQQLAAVGGNSAAVKPYDTRGVYCDDLIPRPLSFSRSLFGNQNSGQTLKTWKVAGMGVAESLSSSQTSPMSSKSAVSPTRSLHEGMATVSRTPHRPSTSKPQSTSNVPFIRQWNHYRAMILDSSEQGPFTTTSLRHENPDHHIGLFYNSITQNDKSSLDKYSQSSYIPISRPSTSYPDPSVALSIYDEVTCGQGSGDTSIFPQQYSLGLSGKSQINNDCMRTAMPLLEELKQSKAFMRKAAAAKYKHHNNTAVKDPRDISFSTMEESACGQPISSVRKGTKEFRDAAAAGITPRRKNISHMNVDIGGRVDPNIVLRWRLRFMHCKQRQNSLIRHVISERDAHRAVVASHFGDVIHEWKFSGQSGGNFSNKNKNSNIWTDRCKMIAANEADRQLRDVVIWEIILYMRRRCVAVTECQSKENSISERDTYMLNSTLSYSDIPQCLIEDIKRDLIKEMSLDDVELLAMLAVHPRNDLFMHYITGFQTEEARLILKYFFDALCIDNPSSVHTFISDKTEIEQCNTRSTECGTISLVNSNTDTISHTYGIHDICNRSGSNSRPLKRWSDARDLIFRATEGLDRLHDHDDISQEQHHQYQEKTTCHMPTGDTLACYAPLLAAPKTAEGFDVIAFLLLLLEQSGLLINDL